MREGGRRCEGGGGGRRWREEVGVREGVERGGRCEGGGGGRRQKVRGRGARLTYFENDPHW